MQQSEWSLDKILPVPQLSQHWAKSVVGLLALLCFGCSYDGDFVFDDSEAIINNKDIRSETPLNNLWEHDFWGTKLASNTSHKSYRPLTVLTFRLNHLMSGGLHPVGFHVVNIALHGAISVVALDVFSVFMGGLAHDEQGTPLNMAPKASFLAALLFAVHPIHTENVAGIVGRADLLCALFFLLSFISYCKAFRKYDAQGKFSLIWILVSLLLCGAAMLCKEQGITILGVNAIFDALVICKIDILHLGSGLLQNNTTSEQKIRWKRGFFTRIFLIASGGIILLYGRWRIMGTGPPAFTEVDNPASFADNILVRTVNYNYYYSLNAWLLVCPWWLCFDWSMGCLPLIKSISDVRVIAPLVLWFFFTGLLWRALCSGNRDERRILTSGITLMIIPFLPASNIFFRVGFVIAERVVYLSSAGYCILLSYGICMLCRQSKRIKVHYNVGKNFADRGRETFAIQYYREAVRLNPKYVHAMNNLGNILKETNKLHEAETLLSKAVAIQPDFAAAWMNLGIVQNSLDKFEDAERSYWTAIKYRKKYPDCYYNLGRLYADLHRHVDALSAWRNATILKPDHSLAWNNLIILLDNTGNLAQAEAIGKEALKVLPGDHTIMFSFANVLGKLKKYKESESLFLNALQINSNIASYHGNLGKMTHIFVYGTIKKGQPNHHCITSAINGKAVYYGKGVTDEKYPLVIASKYNIPYLLNIPGSGQNIAGEIYTVDDKLLQFLDEFEGCPDHYQRIPTSIRIQECAQENTLSSKTENTILKCFMYSKSSYQQEWLNLPFHNNYDAFGSHGLKYVNCESR
ncbi:protein O-mannosyl-transferase TMTC4 isoform X3 [Callorhinchus milii]|uniref:protein O-mannosyl-transferase TMTC4 isoform X3 n=1 Tax=Callorhinchus milii TaxID=7868 RepID=UPI001C3FF312|nr:protein O-mannosyl-transferase TMTC4 isoform X3 [Callorhinchus milii]